MYQSNNTFYTEKHSISFGNITGSNSSNTHFITYANTWENWHLIPSSRPSIAHPTVATKYVEIPGSENTLDLTEYLVGKPIYGQRQGSFSFYVDNEHEDWETIREKIVNTIHGRKMYMVLDDDPSFYYYGRFTVGQWESGASYSSIQISYQLDPYKYRINTDGTQPVVWDTFNFENDYDYYTLLGDSITVNNESKTYNIGAVGYYSLTPTVHYVSGNVSATFGGITKTVNSSNRSATLGTVSRQGALVSYSDSQNPTVPLNFSGTGSVTVEWRGGSL